MELAVLEMAFIGFRHESAFAAEAVDFAVFFKQLGGPFVEFLKLLRFPILFEANLMQLLACERGKYPSFSFLLAALLSFELLAALGVMDFERGYSELSAAHAAD